MTTSIPGPELPQVLSVRGVSKAFGAVQALSSVSVDCRAGEVHALVGENGSGKSTLLGIASGSSRPTMGASRSAGALSCATHRPPPAGSGSASPIRTIRTSSACRSPRTSYWPCRRTRARPTGAWSSGPPRRSRRSSSTSRRRRPRLRCRSQTGSFWRWGRRCSHIRRSCCSMSPRPRSGLTRSNSCTPLCSSRCRRGWGSST